MRSTKTAGKKRITRRRRRSAIKSFLLYGLLAFLTLIAIGILYVIVLFVQISKSLPTIDEIANFTPRTGTKIISSDGVLLGTVSNINRQPVQLNLISPNLKKATLAVEDSRFYEHGGFDLYAIGRAIVVDLRSGNLTSQGASTITQQLARNITEFGLTKRKLLSRKLQELLLAIRMEQTFTKNEILDMYLNQIYYGDGAYGIEAAAETYFNEPAKNLTLPQAALLAGIPDGPSYFDPYIHPNAAIRRRNFVLDRMVKVHYITQAQCDQAKATKLSLVNRKNQGPQTAKAPYFVNYVLSLLESKYGRESIYSGWTVHTTLNYQMQRAAEDALQNGLKEYGHGVTNQAALVAIDPTSGYIRSMIGGANFQHDQFNAITQGLRQPGSSFKLFDYTAAFDLGICTLDSRYRDAPISYPGAGGRPWVVHDYEGYTYSDVTVLHAIQDSINTVAVQVVAQTGVNNVIAYARKMGITTPLHPYLPIALGADAVRPIEMCSAYGMFDNNGIRVDPVAITKITTPNGDVIMDINTSPPHIHPNFLKQTTLDQINEALREVVLHGTGYAAHDVPHAHGKTGTTNNSVDAWFIGYVPHLCTAIWTASEVRNAQGRVIGYRRMPGTVGGSISAPIWRDFTMAVLPMLPSAQQSSRSQSVSAASQTGNNSSQNAQPATTTGNGVNSNGNVDMNGNSNTTSPPAVNGTPPVNSNGAPIQPPSPIPGTGATNINQNPTMPSRSSSVASETSTTSSNVPATKASTSSYWNQLVTVKICVQSGKLATKWCPETITVTLPRKDAPTTYCTIHHPPPGE